MDLGGPAQPVLLRRLAELNASAPVLNADRGKIDPQCLFGTGLYDPHVKSLDANSWLAEERHSHARHDANIQTYTVVRKEPIRAITLTLFLETLAEHCGADLERSSRCSASDPFNRHRRIRHRPPATSDSRSKG